MTRHRIKLMPGNIVTVVTMVNKLTRKVILALSLGLLTSCGVSNVTVTGDYPTPNVEKLPLKLAVLYDNALSEFSYIEYSETGTEEFDIRSGESHIDLFEVVLPAMFDQVIRVGSMEEAQAIEVDAVFAPAIEEFQLALPYKTKLDVYVVWIKYNMRLLSIDGEYIADWVVTSYGKTPTETFRSNEAAINEAAYIALRDLASSFTQQFSGVPEVRDWLASR